MKMPAIHKTALAGLLVVSMALQASAADQANTPSLSAPEKETAEKVFPSKPPYSPYVGRNFPTRPFFGDTQLHTGLSMDAGAFGARLSPRDAYRFAKGEEIAASSGQRVKLPHPLDFLVVADHSDGFGFFPLIIIKAPSGAIIMGWEMTASGYAAVWATDNTREAIWDAMEPKETYATTGPRMLVRFFGGWDFEAHDANTRSPAVVDYTKGVPIGGDLSDAPPGKSPTFLVAALKDPIGANFDRIQIIKGWLDKDGKPQECVYDAAVSGGRKIDADGRCKTPVGNTVDVVNATWTNTIGAGELITVWKDPDFDPSLRAFYYARVIEIPTPRWTAYDAKYFQASVPKDIPVTTQERSYTSPIWYTPAQ